MKSAKYLLVGSVEAYSGKSATILAIIHKLVQQGIETAYGKPLGASADDGLIKMNEQNIRFLAENLSLSQAQMRSPLVELNQELITKRLTEEDDQNYTQQLRDYVAEIGSQKESRLESISQEEEPGVSEPQRASLPDRDVARPFVLLEGPKNLWEGSLFELSIGEMAKAIDASILLVTRYSSLSLVSNLLNAKQLLGDRLLGIVINDIPKTEFPTIENQIKPYLEKRQIPLLGTIPQDQLLHSVSVRELSRRLKAQVLCRPDRLDLMVQGLTIGAMNVNSALEYFRQKTNIVVITGSDRTDLQMAALETSTNCLILTGHAAPNALILSRAEDLEIPILAVDSDTLTTVEVVDAAFGRVAINEPIKAKQVIQLMEQYFDFQRLFDLLDLESALTV